MKRYPRFVLRKIRNGKVKVYGRWYAPDNKWLEYDGRLDDLWYYFGLYEDFSENGQVKLKDFIALHSIKDGDSEPEVVDGFLPWSFWKVKETTQKG